MDADKWLTLPEDLLVDIFRRLETTAVIRCAAACRPWRRAIIDNAGCLQPRPDRFLPEFWEKHSDFPRQMNYIPPVWVDGRLYDNLLASRDGFLLLRVGEDNAGDGGGGGLCVGSDLGSSGSAGGQGLLQDVRILAVAGTDTMCTKENRITYQVFSFGDGTGAWGPVNRSGELKESIQDRCPWTNPGHQWFAATYAVYWFGGPRCDDIWGPHTILWIIALDVRTGRAWTTVLPEGTEVWGYSGTCALLGTSGNALLSLIRTSGTWQYEKQIEVWVLMDDNQWRLQKTIDVVHQVQKLLLPDRRDDYFEYAGVQLNAFCPRSGCVIGSFAGQEIRIDLEGSSRPGVEWIGTSEGFSYCCDTYETNWSTYM